MIRTLAHGVLEVARAIDTGHAIKHGATPVTYRNGRPLAPPTEPAAPGPQPIRDPAPLP